MKDRQPQDTLTADMFRQTSPCADCPFRRVGGVRHPLLRMASYIAYFLRWPGATFPCHRTVPKDDDRSQWSAWREGQTICAGGMIFAEKYGRRNGVMVAGRVLGFYDESQLTGREEVFDTVEEMLKTAQEE